MPSFGLYRPKSVRMIALSARPPGFAPATPSAGSGGTSAQGRRSVYNDAGDVAGRDGGVTRPLSASRPKFARRVRGRLWLSRDRPIV